MGGNPNRRGGTRGSIESLINHSYFTMLNIRKKKGNNVAKADKDTDVSAKKTKRLKMEIKKAHLIILALVLIIAGGGYFGSAFQPR